MIAVLEWELKFASYWHTYCQLGFSSKIEMPQLGSTRLRTFPLAEMPILYQLGWKSNIFFTQKWVSLRKWFGWFLDTVNLQILAPSLYWQCGLWTFLLSRKINFCKSSTVYFSRLYNWLFKIILSIHILKNGLALKSLKSASLKLNY